MFLDFQSNTLTTVEHAEQKMWRIVTRCDDNLFSAQVIIEVMLPALEIRRAELKVSRDDLGLIPDMEHAAKKLAGVRIGPGMTQVVCGLLGAREGSGRMADLALEAMEMLINALTLPELRKALEAGGIPFRDQSEGVSVCLNDRVIGPDMVRLMSNNPRLKDSCAAFADIES
jgi:hypothetical protein